MFTLLGQHAQPSALTLQCRWLPPVTLALLRFQTHPLPSDSRSVLSSLSAHHLSISLFHLIITLTITPPPPPHPHHHSLHLPSILSLLSSHTPLITEHAPSTSPPVSSPIPPALQSHQLPSYQLPSHQLSHPTSSPPTSSHPTSSPIPPSPLPSALPSQQRRLLCAQVPLLASLRCFEFALIGAINFAGIVPASWATGVRADKCGFGWNAAAALTAFGKSFGVPGTDGYFPACDTLGTVLPFPYAMGAGYILSSKLMRYVAQDPTVTSWVEEARGPSSEQLQ